MASSSKPKSSLEKKLEHLQLEIEKLRVSVNTTTNLLWGIDEGGARRLDLIDKDLIDLRSDITNTFNSDLKDQEFKMNKLKGKICKMEEFVNKLSEKWIGNQEENQNPDGTNNF